MEYSKRVAWLDKEVYQQEHTADTPLPLDGNLFYGSATPKG